MDPDWALVPENWALIAEGPYTTVLTVSSTGTESQVIATQQGYINQIMKTIWVKTHKRMV